MENRDAEVESHCGRVFSPARAARLGQGRARKDARPSMPRKSFGGSAQISNIQEAFSRPFSLACRVVRENLLIPLSFRDVWRCSRKKIGKLRACRQSHEGAPGPSSSSWLSKSDDREGRGKFRSGHPSDEGPDSPYHSFITPHLFTLPLETTYENTSVSCREEVFQRL
ncbi:hypothetical protein K402DRAFT_174735 [Aulographum hederae CBS 113979]|uniref:Uncharacterized protein n=1 Tax=Aulographum hederae CBS 113979 TaxID=1176131 RepID=A0A6G1HE39_9PEZI|nr:hypothetical protein K402DRAFT_174735 [Aulographum hederae CBS 113979]